MLELAAPPALPVAPALSVTGDHAPRRFRLAFADQQLALSAGNASGSTQWLMSAFMLLSAAAMLNYIVGKRGHAAAMRERAARYGAYLAQQHERLAGCATQQRIDAVSRHPDPAGLAARIDQRSGLWLCEPDDPDFLSARLGLGRVSAQCQARPPRGEPLLTPDRAA